MFVLPDIWHVYLHWSSCTCCPADDDLLVLFLYIYFGISGIQGWRPAQNFGLLWWWLCFSCPSEVGRCHAALHDWDAQPFWHRPSPCMFSTSKLSTTIFNPLPRMPYLLEYLSRVLPRSLTRVISSHLSAFVHDSLLPTLLVMNIVTASFTMTKQEKYDHIHPSLSTPMDTQKVWSCC